MNMKAAKETLPPVPGGDVRLADYDKTYRTFDWKSVEPAFTWHRTGRFNLAHEAVDRHARGPRADAPALVHTDGRTSATYTFADLARASSRFASALARRGVRAGDRVGVHMPPAVEACIGLLGVLKAGAVPVPIHEAFMGEAVRHRLTDSGASVLLVHASLAGRVPRAALPAIAHVVVAGGGPVPEGAISFEAFMADGDETFEPVWLGREDPLFLHYTSGADGVARGIVLAQVAMVGHLQTGRWVLELGEGDLLWCTAHPGRAAGIACGLFAPWLNGAATLVHSGRFDPHTWAETIASHHVNVWHASPSEFRVLAAAGESFAAGRPLSSLRHLLSTGAVLPPELVRWGWRALGRRIHDHWWMTEAGHPLIANLPGLPIRPGSMGRAMPGVEAAVLDEHGHRVPPRTLGLLCIKTGWPGMMRRVWNDDTRRAAYFRFPGWFFTGDIVSYEQDGTFWFQGRADDVIHTAGERIGPFEVESALLSHPAVTEAGVIGKADPLRGQIVKAFVALRPGVAANDALREALADHVRTTLAAWAAPREIVFRPALPRTRDGRIARHVLRAWDQEAPTVA